MSDGLPELSGSARALFDRAREAGAPSVEEKSRLFEELSEKISAPPVPPVPTGGLAGLSTVGWLSLSVGLGGLLIAGALLMPVASAGVDKTASKPDVQTAESESAEPESAAPAPPAGPPPGSMEAPAPPFQVLAPVRTPVRPESPGSTVSAPVVEEAAEVEAPPRDTLAEELRLIRGAQQAGSGGDLPQALSLLAVHRTRFPNGVLRDERRVATAIFLCEGGDRERGLELAQPFLNTAWGTRVRNACSVERKE